MLMLTKESISFNSRLSSKSSVGDEWRKPSFADNFFFQSSSRTGPAPKVMARVQSLQVVRFQVDVLVFKRRARTFDKDGAVYLKFCRRCRFKELLSYCVESTFRNCSCIPRISSFRARIKEASLRAFVPILHGICTVVTRYSMRSAFPHTLSSVETLFVWRRFELGTNSLQYCSSGSRFIPQAIHKKLIRRALKGTSHYFKCREKWYRSLGAKYIQKAKKLLPGF